MRKNNTRAIGEIFELCGIKLQVVENNTCCGCYFVNDRRCIRKSISGYCSAAVRKDKKSIIFKRINE